MKFLAKSRRLIDTLRQAILVVLVFLLVSEPALVAAQTLQKDPQSQAINLVLQGGDLYLDSVSSVVTESMELLGYVNVVQSTPINQLNEAYIEDVIDRALSVAEQSSIALGAVDDLADGIEQIGTNFPAAMDVSGAAGAGIPDQMRVDLIAQGIPSTQVDQISASVSDLYSERQAGIPADVQASLLGYGFTQSQIDEVAIAVAQRGLVNNNLNTRLAQFRATQDELADTRSGMITLAVQLLGYQIAVRQSNGMQPRAATTAELEALSEDELRILIHAAHLNALWGSDPSAEIGEGDWWFIEHFAERAADRLQTVIVETQNRGLVAELFILRQMKMLAVSARNGDAEYVKSELDSLAALLAHQTNATAYYQQHNTPALPELALARIVATPSLREKVEWPVSSSAVKNARIISQDLMDSSGAQNLAEHLGAFDESNEANNTKGMLIVAGLEIFDQINLDIAQAGLQILSVATPANMMMWITAILTGDTDNPALIAANVILSLIPVLGVIPDIATLVVDPSMFAKALSIFGIIGSIGDLVALIPGLQGVGGASFVGDAVSAVVKTLFKQADNVFKAVLNGLKLADAFDVVADLVKTVVKIVGNSLGNGLQAVIYTISNVFSGSRSLWGDFVAFTRRAGADTLLKLGFDEGSALVGRVLRGGTSLGDEALLAVDKVGDDIARVGVSLTDEGMDGVGVLAKNVDPEDLTKFSDELLAICGAAGSAPGHAKLARPLFRANSDCVNRVTSIIGDLDNAAKTGLNKLCSRIGGKDMAALAEQFSKNADDITAFKKTLGLVSDDLFNGWTSKASKPTLEKFVKFTSEFPESGSEKFLTRLCSTKCIDPKFDEQLFNMLKRMESDSGLRKLLSPSRNDEVYNGVTNALRNATYPGKDPKIKAGWAFQIERGKFYDDFQFGGGLTKFEVKDDLGNNLDLVLTNGLVVEVKYVTNDVISNTTYLEKLVDQIERQARANSELIVEFAERGNASVTDEMIEKTLIPALHAAGVDLSKVDFTTHIY